jgi:hypothetical protein
MGGHPRTLFCQGHELLVVHAAGGREHHAWRRVVFLNVLLQVGPLQRADLVIRAEDRPPQRLPLVCGRMQVIKHHLLQLSKRMHARASERERQTVGTGRESPQRQRWVAARPCRTTHLLVHLLLLAEDDGALGLDGSRVQGRVLQNVGENIHGLGHVALEHLGVVRSLFPRSVRVQVRAHVLHLHLQARLRPLLGPLQARATGARPWGRVRRGAWRVGRGAWRVARGAWAGTGRTLNAMCSKKWAVPLDLSVSNREPASIHTPTVAVSRLLSSVATRKPFLSVVTRVSGTFSSD